MNGYSKNVRWIIENSQFEKIISTLNETYGVNLTEDDKVDIQHIRTKLEADESLRAVLNADNPRDAKIYKSNQVLDRLLLEFVHTFRTDQEKERIRFFNAPVDLLFPVLALGDAFPVDPGIELIGCERVNDLLGEVNILARVGDKDVGHLLTTQMAALHNPAAGCRLSVVIDLEKHFGWQHVIPIIYDSELRKTPASIPEKCQIGQSSPKIAIIQLVVESIHMTIAPGFGSIPGADKFIAEKAKEKTKS